MAIFVPLFIYVKINKSLMMVGELSENRKKIKFYTWASLPGRMSAP
jgi:hypothetical protein